MATTPFAPIRSISMPSRSNPLSTRIEDELTKLRAWADLAAAALPRPESLCKGLNCLAHLHALVDDFLHLPANQQAIQRLRGEKCIEELLSGYVILLDATSAMSGEIGAMKEQAADVLSALRRRGADVAVTRNVEAYIRSRKNSNKVLSRCLKVVKQMDENYPRQAIQKASEEGTVPSVVGLLREVKAVSAVILVSILQFLSTAPPNSSKWSFVSKVIIKGRTQAEEEKQGEANGLSSSDAAIHHLHRQLLSKNVEVGVVHVAKKKLAAIEMMMGSLETGLEAIFRGLIQNRVSLLNSISL